MELIGKKVVNFTNRSTGESVFGVKLFFTYPDDCVKGVACDAKFFNGDSSMHYRASKLIVGSKFSFEYTPTGKVCGINADVSCFEPDAAVVEQEKEKLLKDALDELKALRAENDSLREKNKK